MKRGLIGFGIVFLAIIFMSCELIAPISVRVTSVSLSHATLAMSTGGSTSAVHILTVLTGRSVRLPVVYSGAHGTVLQR